MQSESTIELMTWQAPAVTSIVSGGLLIPEGKAIIFGRWGSFKSMMALNLSFAISTGGDWLGFQTAQSTVMLVQIEISKAEYKKRVSKFVIENGILPQDDKLRWVTEPYFKVGKGTGLSRLEDEITKYHPQVLIIDPVYKVLMGKITDNSDVEYLLDTFDSIAAKYHIAVVLIGHTRKLNPNIPIGQINWGDELIGGSYFMDWADTGIAIVPEVMDRLTMHFLKVRNAEDQLQPLKIKFDRSSLSFRVI